MRSLFSPPSRRRSTLLAAVAAAVAAAAFLNTLPAQFTFDDSFAVLYNGDVTDHSKPLRALLLNDFWGQELRSPMSHKSYRPLTTLSFRLQHWASTRLLPAAQAHPQRSEWEEGGQRGGDSTLSPLPFHLCNVAAHAGVTALVFALARRLALSRSSPASLSPPAAAGSASSSSSSSSGGGSNSLAAADANESSAEGTADVEAFLAALLFGLHPVHCEAVAGVVGHAELLCAGLSIPALLCYMAAADGRAGRGAGHWRAVAAAVLLGWGAALAKEIGITIMGAMLCYDALVAPLGAPQAAALGPGDVASPAHKQGQGRPVRQQQREQQQELPGRQLKARSPAASARPAAKAALPAPSAVAAAATELLQQAAAAGTPGSTPSKGGGRLGSTDSRGGAAACREALRLKLFRSAAALAAVLLYVKARSWLAGDQLVRIYRKVENPIAFSESPLERKLTTGYLHARYAWLLLAPLQLSADWSYACIEYVSSLSDPRNLATAALYLALLWLGLAARPWEVPLEWAGRRPSAAPSRVLQERRWRLAVTAGLLVGPFFPASNVLFYVGTFIGERLLYFPSVGYCILLAQPLAAALAPLLPQQRAGSEGRSAVPSGCEPSRPRRAGAALAAALLAGLLLFYAGRTVLRNEDWRDEERLFLSAQKVCWRSGKVQLNSGIVERRHQNWDKAEMHFRLAKEVDPGFCEPDYHIGITLLGKNLTAALEQLELGVRCKYTAADSVKALNRIYMSLLERSPGHATGVMERWAAVLAMPQLQRYTEAATYFETAAAKASTPLAAIMVLNRAQAALLGAAPVPVGRTPEFPVRVPASQRQLEVLGRCMEGRQRVILALLGAGGRATAPEVKQAAYRYIAEHGDACRGPVPLPDEPDPADRAARTTSYHTNLIHTLQEADANDPWLQQEWGLMLAATGRQREALVHLEVAGHIFAAQLASAPADSAPAAGIPQGSVLNAEGTGPISQAEAATAAAAAYRHAQAVVASVSASDEGAVDPAARQRMLCHLHQAECAVLQRAAALPSAAAGAAADALGCWGRARALGCAAAAPVGSGKGRGSSPVEGQQEEGDILDAERDEL